jgi:hypothetical protein
MIEPVEHLLGAQLGGLGIEPGFLEQRGDLRAGQADQIDRPSSRAVTWRGTGTGSTWPGIGMGQRPGKRSAEGAMGACGSRSWRRYTHLCGKSPVGADGPRAWAAFDQRRSQPVMASLGAPAKGATSDTEWLRHRNSARH